MLELNGLDIEISRGDTGSVRVSFIGEDIPEDGTKALVSVKNNLNQEEVVWEKLLTVTNAGCVIPLTHEDTSIGYGVYRWDLRLIYEDNSIYTPMRPARFIISERVGNAEAVRESG